MFSITFVFDSLPDLSLSGNGRLHWRSRAARVKQEREYARLLGISNKGQWVAPQKAIISFEFHSSTKKVFDLDNAISACKSWIDGLRDAGILIKDDCWHLSYGSAQVVSSKYDETRLILEAVN
jgi:hypothetical protein